LIRFAALLALAGCVDVASEYVCGGDSDCVLDGAQGRCEPEHHCSMPDTSCGDGGFRYHASAGVQAGICVLSTVVGNLPAFDLKQARDTVHGTCAPAGARDVSFEVTVPEREAFLIDTAAQATNASVRFSVYGGPCPVRPDAMNVTCSQHDCGSPVPPYDRLATRLEGTACIVVEEDDPSAPTGSVALRVAPGSRDSDVLMPTQTGTTCGSASDPGAGCVAGSPAPVSVFLVPICPGQRHVTATVTPSAPLDPAVALRADGPAGGQLACGNSGIGSAAETAAADISETGPVWLVVGQQASGPSCGPFSITSSLTP
jgi:hypothetical protein